MSTQTPSQGSDLPLDDVMLAMDVVDTLRHRQDLVDREIDGANREARLIEKLRQVYHQQGIEVPDHILKEGVAALDESRFVYTPPAGGFKVWLAHLYVSRGRWGRAATIGFLVVLLAVSVYAFLYRPYVRAQAEAARIEISKTLPAKMDTLYKAIYDETKVQKAATEAAALRDRGKAAARAGDKAGAEAAVTALTALRDKLQRAYTLEIVNQPGVKSGFWTFPEVNTEATNYYIVVEAIDDTTQKPLSLPIINEENGKTEKVDMWGVRVPEYVYRSVEADKRDNGIIDRNIVGVKQYGFLDVDYVVPVLGGTVTHW